MTRHDSEVAALRDAIAAHAASYKEMADNWRAVDGKAQAVITVAGIFIAAAFALVRDAEALASPVTRVGVIVVVLLLVTTVLVSASVLRLRDAEGPVAGDDFERMASDLARSLDGPSREEQPAEASASRAAASLEVRYMRQACTLWRDCLETVARHHDAKARRLFVGQQCLVAAVIAGAGLTVFQVVLLWFS